MSQVENSRVFKYPIALVAAAGGLGLMLVAALAQTVTFGFSEITALSLAIPFLTGAVIALFLSGLLQRRLAERISDIENEKAAPGTLPDDLPDQWENDYSQLVNASPSMRVPLYSCHQPYEIQGIE